MADHCNSIGDPTFWSFVAAEWWVPRFECGWFPWWLVLLYAGTQLFLAYTYWTIGRELKRDENMRTKMAHEPRRFSQTFMMCGMAHFFDGVVVFVWPHYVFFAVVHLYAGVTAGRARRVLVDRLEAYERVESIVRKSKGTENAHSVLESLRKITESGHAHKVPQ